MTSITQKIPNFIGGISQQPDELMPTGSLREALNVIPDVTDGLRKRTGSRLVNPLVTTETGSWFHFNFSDNEKYIGKVNYNGQVDIFSAANGLPSVVSYAEYVQNEENDGVTGYPDCDIDQYNEAKINYTAKKKEYDDLNDELNAVEADIDAKSQSSERVVNYEVVNNAGDPQGNDPDEDITDGPDSGFYGYESQVYRGWARANGNTYTYPAPPEGWTARRGNKRGDTYKGAYIFTDRGWKYEPGNVVFYEWIHEKDAVIPTEDIVKKEQLEDQIDLVKQELDELEEILQSEANKCGLSINRITRDLIATNVVPKYLEHTTQNQIRNLVVGNRVFLINPLQKVGMTESSIPPRPRENFIEINTAAPTSDYSLELVAEDTNVTPYTEVREANIISGLVTVDNIRDDGGAGQWRGFATETFDNNLTLELTISGQQIQTGDGTDIDDFKYVYSGNVRVLNPGVGYQKNDTVTMTVSDRDYKIQITEVETVYTAEGAPITVPITPNGTDSVVKASTILSDIAAAIETYDSNFTTQVIGNGVWVTHVDPDYVWRFSCPNKALVTITTDQVNSVVQLPTQCRAGYVVKVSNTDSDDDDYYAQFITEEKGVDGPGVWEETVAPGINRYLNYATMPHQISRQSSGSFVVSPVEWDPREVGDEKTNPDPSFVGHAIQNMVLFRSRICILSQDNISCSRTNDFFNFWFESALTAADTDPVDLSCGSSASSSNSVLTDAIEINQGLVCFTGAEQFILGSDSEAFTPSNARFSRVGTHRHSDDAPVFSLGNSIGFLADSGLSSRLLEMLNVGQTSDSAVNELTKPVSRLIPFGINLLADTKDNNLIVLGKVGSSDLWVYRYFDNDQNRVQSSWFKWKLPAPLVYHCIMDDVYWSVSYSFSDSEVNEGKPAIVALQRIDIKDTLATAFADEYEIHLDNYRIAQPSEFTYYSHINQTYFRAPLVYYKDQVDAGNLVAYMLSPTQLQESSPLYGEGKQYYFRSIGSKIPVRVEEDNLGTWFVMDGDWSNTRMMIGYQFEMNVELPTIYPAQSQVTSTGTVTRKDTRGYLNLHRVKLNLGHIGVMETCLKVRGREDYIEMYECKTMDGYDANDIAFDNVKTQVIPVYSRNTDTTIQIKSIDPSPCTIHSLSWEGDYGNKWYKNT